VITCTGASAKWLAFHEREQRLKSATACLCRVMVSFKGKEVAIVGAGDTAAEIASISGKLCSVVIYVDT